MDHKDLIASMATALYEYATTRSLANWDNRRPGLRLPSIEPTQARSCGAFRAWKIHAHDGRVCFSMDGYRYRDSNDRTGAVGVLVGQGPFHFPHDNSCGHHSLHMQVPEGSRIVWVTDRPELGWQPAIVAMRDVLVAAKESIDASVALYDREQVEARDRKRREELEAASAVLTVR